MPEFFGVLCLLLIALLFAQLVTGTTRVLVVGAGPAGLLTAHCLLSRDKGYRVHVIDSREPPEGEALGLRAYSLGLNIRGQTALKHFDRPGRSVGLWAAVRSAGVECDSFFLHLGQRAVQIRKSTAASDPEAPPPTILLPRNKLCDAMKTNLLGLHGGPNLDIEYGCRLERLDIDKKVAYFGGKEYSYDLVIGADGVQSPVRKSLFGEFKRPHYECSEATLPGQFKVMVQSSQASQLDSSSIHLLTPSNGFSLFVVPAPGNIFCTLVNWSGTSPPKALSEATTADALSGAIGQAFPKLGPVMAEAAEQLLRQKASVAQTIQCNTYTDNRGVLLLGDAAHSTGGTLGQGANSALMDVVALDACLDEAGDDLGRALPLFSNRQTVEGLALWKLLQLPPKGLIGLLFAVMQAFRPYIRRVRKRWPKPVQTELSQSLTPFSEIVEENSFWLRWTGRMQNSVKPIRHNL